MKELLRKKTCGAEQQAGVLGRFLLEADGVPNKAPTPLAHLIRHTVRKRNSRQAPRLCADDVGGRPVPSQNRILQNELRHLHSPYSFGALHLNGTVHGQPASELHSETHEQTYRLYDSHGMRKKQRSSI
jgi:hypothetical protein